jgi:Cysteine rich repeat
MRCKLDNYACVMQASYSRTCREQLQRQVERRVKDWRLDYDLRNACREDVGKVGRTYVLSLFNVRGMYVFVSVIL